MKLCPGVMAMFLGCIVVYIVVLPPLWKGKNQQLYSSRARNNKFGTSSSPIKAKIEVFYRLSKKDIPLESPLCIALQSGKMRSCF